ncbi:MAG TPA: tetratricopeptide repeat protein [Flavobacteriales bacterium]|nr:tetratricopeptide repeat protein [Flavobacteriales bacterium]HRJ39691.1 tetratricopeptide repeat protein [Flavobacteriales bacterium]
MKKRIFQILCALLFTATAFAQSADIAELEKKLKSATSQKEKLEITVDIAKKTMLLDTERGFSIARKGYDESVKLKDKILECKFLNVLAIGHMFQGENIEARKKFDQALELSRIYKDQAMQEKILGNIGYLYEFQGQIDSALSYYHMSVKLSIARKDTAEIADCYNGIGAIYTNTGKFDSAQYYLKRSYGLHELKQDTEGKADALFNLGMTYYYTAKKDLALGLFIKTRSIYDSLNLENKSSRVRMSIAQTLFDIGRYDEARKEAYKVLRFFEKMQDAFYIANTHYIIANTFEEQNEDDSSMAHYQISRDVFRESGNTNGLGSALSSIGILLTKQKKFNEALLFLKEALPLKIESQDSEGIANVNRALASVYYQLGNTMSALHHAELAREEAERSDMRSQLKDIYLLLSEVYEKTGQYDRSLKNLRKYVSFRDSLESEENRKALAELETQYKTQEQIAQNQLLEEQKKVTEALLIAEEEAGRKRSILLYASISVAVLLLGLSVIIIRANRQRKKANDLLAQRNEQIIAQNASIREQKDIIEEKQKEITDSINYARRIQFALLAHEEVMKNELPEHFVLFQPKDIVSGDFYWATKKDADFYLAVCDSTGHGVPGAFMSLLNISFLNEAITEKVIKEPGAILDHTRSRLISNISQQGQKDGMDGILLRFSKQQISYAAAHNNPVIVRNGELIELPADKMPIGQSDYENTFNTHFPELQKGDMLYLYTDGYADQFGGPKGKKFKYSTLNQLLIQISQSPLSEQKSILETTIQNWKGDLEQVDDICVIGIRV